MKPSFHGENCRTCGQLVKLYKRPISGMEAARLIRLYVASKNNPKKEFFHLRDFSPAGYNASADFHKLKYMGLVEEKPAESSDEKKNSGYWKITDNGKLFVETKSTVPKYALIFDGKLFGFMGPNQSINDRLGKKFNYGDLMAGESQ